MFPLSDYFLACLGGVPLAVGPMPLLDTVGWCKSEFDRPPFAVFHAFLLWKTTESRSHSLETPTERPQSTRGHLEVPRPLNHAIRGFCQIWLAESPKSCSLRLWSGRFLKGIPLPTSEVKWLDSGFFFSSVWISFDLWSSLQPQVIQALFL